MSVPYKLDFYPLKACFLGVPPLEGVTMPTISFGNNSASLKFDYRMTVPAIPTEDGESSFIRTLRLFLDAPTVPLVLVPRRIVIFFTIELGATGGT